MTTERKDQEEIREEERTTEVEQKEVEGEENMKVEEAKKEEQEIEESRKKDEVEEESKKGDEVKTDDDGVIGTKDTEEKIKESGEEKSTTSAAAGSDKVSDETKTENDKVSDEEKTDDDDNTGTKDTEEKAEDDAEATKSAELKSTAATPADSDKVEQKEVEGEENMKVEEAKKEVQKIEESRKKDEVEEESKKGDEVKTDDDGEIGTKDTEEKVKESGEEKSTTSAAAGSDKVSDETKTENDKVSDEAKTDDDDNTGTKDTEEKAEDDAEATKSAELKSTTAAPADGDKVGDKEEREIIPKDNIKEAMTNKDRNTQTDEKKKVFENCKKEKEVDGQKEGEDKVTPKRGPERPKRPTTDGKEKKDESMEIDVGDADDGAVMKTPSSKKRKKSDVTTDVDGCVFIAATTPSSAEGKRRRKSSSTVSYVPEDFTAKQGGSIQVTKGRGQCLRDLPGVKANVEKYNLGSDEFLQAYRLLFPGRGKLKKNVKSLLLDFSGYLEEVNDGENLEKREKRDENSEAKFSKRAYKLHVPQIKSLCDFFDIDRTPSSTDEKVDKEMLVDRLLDFLSAPNKESTNTEKKNAKKSPSSKKIGVKKPLASKKKSKDDTEADDDIDEQEEDDDEDYDAMELDDDKKKTKTKSPNSKKILPKKKTMKTKHKKKKDVPSDKMLEKWVRAFLFCHSIKKSTFKSAMKIVTEKYEVDLTSKKKLIKQLIVKLSSDDDDDDDEDEDEDDDSDHEEEEKEETESGEGDE